MTEFLLPIERLIERGKWATKKPCEEKTTSSQALARGSREGQLPEPEQASYDNSCGLAARHTHLVEAGTAIDRAVFGGQEWNLRFIPTLGADNGVHFAWRAVAGTPTGIAGAIAAGSPAGRTTGGLVHQTLLLVKFLLTRGEDKVAATVAALERFVLEVQLGTSL